MACFLLPLATACIIPYDIEPEDAPLPPATHPPRVVLESVQPSEPAVVVTENECTAPLALKFAVADEDTDQTIAVRWFVNYPDDVDPFISSSPPTATRGLVRPVDPFEFEVFNKPAGVYVVDVVVADEFEQDTSVPPKNRAVKGKPGVGASSSYRWVIWVKAEACRTVGGG